MTDIPDINTTDPRAPQARRRRRRNTTLMAMGIAQMAGAQAAGTFGIANEVLVNAQWTGLALAVCGAGLYTWTLLDRMKLGPGDGR